MPLMVAILQSMQPLVDRLTHFLGREIFAGLTVFHLLLGGTLTVLVLHITGIGIWDILRHRKTAL